MHKELPERKGSPLIIEKTPRIPASPASPTLPTRYSNAKEIPLMLKYSSVNSKGRLYSVSMAMMLKKLGTASCGYTGNDGNAGAMMVLLAWSPRLASLGFLGCFRL